jgi:hypothetical protein
LSSGRSLRGLFEETVEEAASAPSFPEEDWPGRGSVDHVVVVFVVAVFVMPEPAGL